MFVGCRASRCQSCLTTMVLWSQWLAERSCNSTIRSTTRPTSPTTTRRSSSSTRLSPRPIPLPLSNCRAPSNSTAEVSLSLSLSLLLLLLLSRHACCWNSFHSLMVKLRKNLWYFQFNSGSFFVDKNRASILDILLRGPPNSKSKVHFLCFCFSKIESTVNTNVSCNLWQSPPQPKVWKV